MADFRDHASAVADAGYDVAGISTDAIAATALLQSDLFVPFDLLSDLDRSVVSTWDLLNESEHGGVPVPAVFAIGRGRIVLARSIDSMTRQVDPQTFLAAIQPGHPAPPKRRFVWPRLLEYLRLNRRITRASPDR